MFLIEPYTAAAVCTSGSADVGIFTYTAGLNPLDLGDTNVKEGDLLILTYGENSLVDVGYGPGVYPIAYVSGNTATLTVSLTSGEDSSWKIVRRR